MMSRKHFRQAADYIRHELEQTGDRDAAQRHADHMGQLFAGDNPRFEWTTFLRACGLFDAGEATK